MGSGKCQHDSKLKVIREKRGYVWRCADCEDEMVVWVRAVWEALGLDELVIGEGFTFNIVKRGSDETPRL